MGIVLFSREPETRHSGSGHLGHRRRQPRCHDVERSRAHRYFFEHRGTLYQLHRSDRICRKVASAGSNWPAMSVWSLGRWGLPMNVIAISYTVVISVVLVVPPNELSGKTLLGVMIVLVSIYLTEIRGKFRGPEWTREATSLTTEIPKRQ
jgi:hypothetical protein